MAAAPHTAGLAIGRPGGAATRAERPAPPRGRPPTAAAAGPARCAGWPWPSSPAAGRGPPAGCCPADARVAGRPPAESGGPRLDLLRRQGLPGQAELRGPQAGDLLAEDP